MKTNLKRMAAWLLTVLMIVSCVPASASDGGNVVEYGATMFSAIEALAIPDTSKITRASSGYGRYTFNVPIYYYNSKTNEITHSESRTLNSGNSLTLVESSFSTKLTEINGAYGSSKLATGVGASGYNTTSVTASGRNLHDSNDSNITNYNNYAVYVAYTPNPPRQYTVTFVQNSDGNRGGQSYSQTVEEGSALSFPALPAGWEVEGQTFSGWSTDYTGVTSMGAGAVFASGVQWMVDANTPKLVTADVTFYGIWIPSEAQGTTKAYFHIRLDGTIPFEPSSHDSSGYTDNHGMTGSIKSPVSVNNNLAAVAANIQTAPSTSTILNKLQQKGEYSGLSVAEFEAQYRVVWYVIKKQCWDDKTQSYTDWHVDGVVIPRTSYLVNYHANGGTGTPDSHAQHEDDQVNVSFSPTPTRVGYTFLGWSEDPNAQTPTYTQNGTHTFTMPPNDVNLYAVWQPNNSTKYTVEYYYSDEDGVYPSTAAASTERTGVTDTMAAVTDADKTPQRNGYELDDAAPGKVYEGTIAAEGTLVLKVYFKYTGGPAKKIDVEKKWVGQQADSVTVTLLKNGTATNTTLELTSANGWQGSFTNLPTYDTDGEEIQYTVSENALTDYITTIAPETANANKYTVTNTYNKYSLTIYKLVSGNMADRNKKFAFSVVVKENGGDDASILKPDSGAGYTVADDGKITVTGGLAHGEHVTINGIPYGAAVYVTEEADGYTPKSTQGGVETSGNQAKVNIYANSSVTFTNDNTATIDTGVSLDILPYILLLAVAGGAAVLLVAMSRKRRKED